MAALAGLLVGGIAGALVSYGLVPIYARFYSDEAPSLLLPFLVRGGIWAVVGMAAGLALGWGWQGFRGIPGFLIGGLSGSVCGTIAFEVVNALLFPGDRNDAVIPSSMQVASAGLPFRVRWRGDRRGASWTPSIVTERPNVPSPVVAHDLTFRVRSCF